MKHVNTTLLTGREFINKKSSVLTSTCCQGDGVVSVCDLCTLTLRLFECELYIIFISLGSNLAISGPYVENTVTSILFVYVLFNP